MDDGRKCPKKVIRSIKWVALIRGFYNILIYRCEEMSVYRPTPHSPPTTWRDCLIFNVNLTVSIMPAKHPFLTWCFSDRASWINYILITKLMHWSLFIL